MPSVQDQLDSITESVICIPFNQDVASEDDSSEDEDEDFTNEIFTLPNLKDRDMVSGPRVRREAYERAWSLCLGRMKTVIHNMQTSVTDGVVDAVHNAYRNTLPLLPHTELPVFAISSMDRSVMSTVFQDIREQLTNGDEGEPSAYVATLSASECTNITNMMKSMISEFVSHSPSRSGAAESQSRTKQNASSCLAPYDINVLKAWFQAVRSNRGDEPRLIILMKDFEQFDPAIMQQLFYICSQSIPHLPIVFVISLSTPITQSNSFIHSAYPRSTLALLRIKRFQSKSGMEVLKELLLETFFSVDFQPAIILGPSTIDYIVEQYSRYSMSTDLVIAILQLVHLRHFAEPLTAFVHDQLLGKDHPSDTMAILEQSTSHVFVKALAARLHHPDRVAIPSPISVTSLDNQKSPNKSKGKARQPSQPWLADSIEGLLALLRKTHETVHSHARQSRVAFVLFSIVRTYLVQCGLGYKNNAVGLRSTRSGGDGGMTVFEMMSACLRGTLVAKDGKYMSMVIRKLTAEQLQQLLSRVYEFLHKLPSDLRREHKPAVLKLVKWMNISSLNGSASPTNDVSSGADTGVSTSGKLGAEFTEWLMEYLSERMTDMSELNLWDLWYTGNPSVISEVLNPSPREAIISALLHPEDYLHYANSLQNSRGDSEDVAGAAESEMAPDLTILYRLYLESGKSINVYDWYQAFEVTLEAEKKRAEGVRKAADKGHGGGKKKAVKGMNGKGNAKAKGPRSPTNKGKRKTDVEESPTKSRSAGRPRKGKSKAAARDERQDIDDSDTEMHDPDDGHSNSDMDEEASEHWRREVLFRFLRAVQELDFLGFLKQTRRKRDHVGKTVYDMAE